MHISVAFILRSSTVLTLVLLAELIHGDGIIRLHFLRFTNYDGRDVNNNKCDGYGSITLSKCDHKFTLQFDYRGPYRSSGFPKWKFQTPEFTNEDDIIFGSSLGNGISNPMHLAVSNFQSLLYFHIEIMDADPFGSDDFVEDFAGHIFLDSSLSNQVTTLHGRQSKLTFAYQLICDANWFGSNCSVYCRENSNYVCNQYSGDKICKVGWLNPNNNCQTIDFCSSSPCLNGGRCTNTPIDFQCTCRNGYTGKTCDQSPCRLSRCLNGGTCKESSTAINFTVCVCPLYFDGIHCETQIGSDDPCFSNPCHNNGNCEHAAILTGSVVNVTSFICRCAEEFRGHFCEEKLSRCDYNNPCFNGGFCAILGTPPSDSYQCHCSGNFTGHHCNQPTCTQTCFNGGTCVEIDDSYQCNCTNAFQGINCTDIKGKLQQNTSFNISLSLLSSQTGKHNLAIGLIAFFTIIFILALVFFILFGLHKRGKINARMIFSNMTVIEKLRKYYRSMKNGSEYIQNGNTNEAYEVHDDNVNNLDNPTYAVSQGKEYVTESEYSTLGSPVDGSIRSPFFQCQPPLPPISGLSFEKHDIHNSNNITETPLDSKPTVVKNSPHDKVSSQLNAPSLNNFNIKNSLGKGSSSSFSVYDEPTYTFSQLNQSLKSVDLNPEWQEVNVCEGASGNFIQDTRPYSVYQDPTDNSYFDQVNITHSVIQDPKNSSLLEKRSNIYENQTNFSLHDENQISSMNPNTTIYLEKNDTSVMETDA